MERFIQVRDRQDVLTFSFDDLLKYHGRFNIGGVALAFRIIEEAAKKMSHHSIPDRYGFSFRSGIGPNGTGVIDAVEMVTRAKTYEKLTIDNEWLANKPGVPTPNGAGKYYFEIGYEGRWLGFELKPGLIPEEFMVLTRKLDAKKISASEQNRLRDIKEDLAGFVMKANISELFVIHEAT